MKIFRYLVIIMIVLFLAGCTKWQEPELTPRAKAENARQQQKALDSLEPHEQFNADTTNAKSTVNDSGSDKPASVETTHLPSPDMEPATNSDIQKPDCDGRLIPTYNFRNEITGYRCDTNSDNFECPGHRAGDTWTKDGKDCECLDDGSIKCTE